ncbi:MAG: hypothetical protein ACPG5T_09850, partial [Endozoicomonas sp.]
LRSAFSQKMDDLDGRLRNLVESFDEGVEDLRQQGRREAGTDPDLVRKRGDANPEKEVNRYRDDLDRDGNGRLRNRQKRDRDPLENGNKADREKIERLRDKCGLLIQKSVGQNLDAYSDLDGRYSGLDKGLQTTDDAIKNLNVSHQSDVQIIESFSNPEGEGSRSEGDLPLKSQLAQIETILNRNAGRQKEASSLELELKSHINEKGRIDSELNREKDRVEQKVEELGATLDKVAREVLDQDQRDSLLGSVAVDLRSAEECLEEKKSELEERSQQCNEKIGDLTGRLSALKSSISGFSEVLKAAKKDVLHRGKTDGAVNPEDLLKGHDEFYDDDLKLINSTVNLGKMLLKSGSGEEVDIHDYINTSKLRIDESSLNGLPEALVRDLNS